MAGTDETLQPAPIAVSSYDTALCVVPPQSQCSDIDQLRSLYDKAYGRWPSHINLIYPFVSPEALPRAKEQIQARLNHRSFTENIQNIRLDQAGYFSHRSNHTVYLAENQARGMKSLDTLHSATLEALGQTPTPCNFHLTVGQSEDKTESAREFLLSKAYLLPQLDFPITSLAILIRESIPGQEKSASRMRLWGTVSVSGTTSLELPTPISEYWIQAADPEELALTVADGNDGSDLDEPATTSVPSREVQPRRTYHYTPSSDQWTTVPESYHPEIVRSSLSISSYNVLIDSEYPPSRERDPLLLKTILSRSALADVLILQEVSDDFLSYLLADSKIRHCYPFTTHGPPSQSDIGPLPSLRNVVFLSRYNFTWEMVPFHRKHKGAVVAKFSDGMHENGEVGQPPIIVAGVHLTCGLTDGSVAAKKIQIQILRNYLTRQYPSNSWVVAGDFNLTTSRYTIETALKSKSISQQTVETISSIEATMSDIGLLDAWSVARIEAVDDTAVQNPADLFDGEEGATFNPRENILAATTSGTSNNRPQRYDKILFRQDMLHVSHFSQFGLPIYQDGQHLFPSDHSGVRASLRVIATRSDNPDMLELYPVRRKLTAASLANTSSLTEALTAHGMFPTHIETQGRREAFALIKKVLLGSSDDEDTSMSDVPMVVVPVGSYALGVWTSTSDIDCLCIGSISSKIFFKLARQRIHKAAVDGVRFLRKVEASTGTMLELSVNGVAMDLQYCPATRIVERWSEVPDLHHSDAIFNLSMLSLRKLKPYRDITYIQRSLPSLPIFRLAYRCIKLWAVQRGLYSSRFGYLSGIHITLMLSWIYKRMAYDSGSVTTSDLVATFFHHYAHYNWRHATVFDPFFHKKQPRYQRSPKEPMVVLGFHAPNANVAHTSTVPGLKALVKEFKTADERLSQDGLTWDQFLGNPNDSNAGVVEFLHTYDSYVQIKIQYWGRSLSKGKGLVGWVESRCLLLVVDINKALENLEIRIWPSPFTATEAANGSDDYQSCYLIGLSRTVEAEPSGVSKEETSLAKEKLRQSFSRFVDLLHADEKYYDPETSWIGVDLVKPREVKDLRLDDRKWGDFMPDPDADSDEEDEIEESMDETDDLNARAKLPIRQRTPQSNAPVSTSKLRPASDVLHRLRWDPNLDPSEYIVGYEDRFLGAKETSLERWKTEQTDDEFIPQHRILYFKRRSDGVLVWERRTRVDLIFGSGISAGTESN